MGIKTLIMILASLSFSVSALADHHDGEKKPFSINGDFATSLSFYDNENTGGANHDDFNVDLIEINLEKNWSKSKLHLSIGYGTTATGVNPNLIGAAATTTLNVMNAYYHMHTSYGLGFSVGKFESPVGHETYNHMDNSQYTRSWGFNLAPYFHTGAQVSYGQDMWSAGLIVSNGRGRDTDTADRNKTMTLVVDVDPMENLHFDLNYVTGTEGTAASTQAVMVTNQITVLDFSAAYMVNEMLDFALNYLAGTQKPSAGGTELEASSIAVYGNANFGMFGLGLRYEMVSYDGGFASYNGAQGNFALQPTTGTDNDLSAITLTAKAEIDQNAQVLLEYRTDSSDDQLFTDKDGNASDSMSTITAALMYRF